MTFFSSFYFVLPVRVFIPDRMRSRDDAASCSRRSPPLSSRRRPSRSPRRRTSRSPLPRRRCVPAVSHLSLIVFNLRTFNRVPLRLSFNSLTLESFFFFFLHWCCFRSVERGRLGYKQQARSGSQDRRRRSSREKDDKFKGSLSEGMKAEQDESDEA